MGKRPVHKIEEKHVAAETAVNAWQDPSVPEEEEIGSQRAVHLSDWAPFRKQPHGR
jgi:hypothetical protein